MNTFTAIIIHMDITYALGVTQTYRDIYSVYIYACMCVPGVFLCMCVQGCVLHIYVQYLLYH